MTDSGSARPRRALAPLPDDDVDVPPGDDDVSPPLIGRRALRAQLPDDWEPADADTQVLRRLVVPAESPSSPVSPSEPSAPAADRVWTPAPPRPVLPSSASASASAGRRFSASSSPQEATYTPRRSAASVASPPEDFFVRRTRPEPATISAEPAPLRTEDPAPEATPARRSGKRALIVLGGVVAVAGLVYGGVTWLAPKSPAVISAPTPSTSPSVSLDPLLGATDLARLGAGAWETAAETPGGGDGNPVCLPVDGASMPDPDRTERRVLTSPASDVEYVSHVVDSYPDRTSAARAYQLRLQQSGSCDDTDALIVAAYNVTGLADNAFVTQIQVQGATTENHTVLVSQTGRSLSMIEVVSAEPVLPEDVAAVAAGPLARLCSGGQGACPSTPKPEATVPAAGEHPGWLVAADLPRITPGAGRWAASEPESTLRIVGSQCELVDLKKVEGIDSSAQRTLLLADDPAAPSTAFGVDQVVYTFPTAKAAKTFADQVTGNLAACADTVPTATVEKGPSAKGEGAAAIAYSGKSYLVTQQTGGAKSTAYRVGVVRIADRVAYLLANPSADFDFSDAQWKAILARTGERVTQMP